MSWSHSGIPILRISGTATRQTQVKEEEIVKVSSLPAPTTQAKQDPVETNKVPIIAVQDDEKGLITRAATAEETVAVKEKRKPSKAKTVVEKIKQVFIPEE